MRVVERSLAVAIAAALAGLPGCTSRDAESMAGPPALRDTLATTADPVAASNAVRGLAKVSCAGLTTALGILDRRAATDARWDAATIRGLVTEAVEWSGSACPAELARSALAGHVGEAHALARAHLAGGPELAVAALAPAPPTPAVLRERATRLLGLQRLAEARRDLVVSLALEEHAETRAMVAHLALQAGEPAQALRICGDRQTPRLRETRAAALAALGRYDDAVAEITSGPMHLRRSIAAAAAGAAADRYAFADAAVAPPELLVAVAAHAAGADDPARAAALLARAAELVPSDASIHAALAEAREASGDPLGAVASWDRAAETGVGDVRAVLAPIRILADNDRAAEASRRARALATSARAAKSADDLHTASLAAEYATDHAGAIALAREASAARPTDGRLRSELGARLERAGRHADAADVLAALLVCGAHGRPWHRHDLTQRLAALREIDAAVVTAAVAKVACPAVDEPDLATHLDRLRSP